MGHQGVFPVPWPHTSSPESRNTSRVGAGSSPCNVPGLGRTRSHDPWRNAFFQPQMAPSGLLWSLAAYSSPTAIGAQRLAAVGVSSQPLGRCSARAPPGNPPRAYPPSGGVGGSIRGAGREEGAKAALPAHNGCHGDHQLPGAQGLPKDVGRRDRAQRELA